MQLERRRFLRSSAGLASLQLAGLIAPQRAQAQWPGEAFGSLDMNEAVRSTLGSEFGTPDPSVYIDAPDYVHDTSIVEIRVASSLPEIDAVAVLIRENPLPLAAIYRFPKRSGVSISNRLDLDGPSEIVAVVRSQGTLFSNYHRVVVTRTVTPELYDPYDDLFEIVE